MRFEVEVEENCRDTSHQEQAGDNYICTQGDGPKKNVQLHPHTLWEEDHDPRSRS